MGKVLMVATVSIDGFIAGDDDQVGPLFDWYSGGDVAVTMSDTDRVFHVTEASAAYIRSSASVRVAVVGRHLFDITNGWNGVPPNGEHVVVVTHAPPTDWGFPDAPFQFISDGVAAAIARARELAGDGDVSITAGDVGGQALQDDLVDEIHLSVAPVLLGSGKRFFGTSVIAERMLDNPRVVEGDRVLHLVYPVRR